jgi:hypothetical protein
MVLHAPLGTAPGARWTRTLLEGLPYARRLALERRPAPDLHASLAGLALALCACARLREGRVPALNTLAIDAGGKPRFIGGPGFSLSHCESHVACVATAAGDVGIDLETVPEDSRRAELARWTAIEAVLKAAGAGLRRAGDVDLAVDGSSGRLDGERFVLQGVASLPAGLVAHVASGAPLELSAAAVSLADPEIASAVERSLGLSAQRT